MISGLILCSKYVDVAKVDLHKIEHPKSLTKSPQHSAKETPQKSQEIDSKNEKYERFQHVEGGDKIGMNLLRSIDEGCWVTSHSNLQFDLDGKKLKNKSHST